MKRTLITLKALLFGDRATLFQINPGDEVVSADLTVAEVKEIACVLNAHAENFRSLHKDLLAVEARIDTLERRMEATQS
jgi:hypothetical protein